MTHFSRIGMGDIVVPITDAAFDPLYWPKAGAYPLFPYHNRMSGARFTQDGHAYAVTAHPSLNCDAMHGPAQRRPWHVVSHQNDRLELALDYTADDDWPFSFRAVQIFTIDGEGLDIGLRLTNASDASAPAGMGWHPYLAASLERDTDCDAAIAFPLNDLNLPTGDAGVSREPGPLPASAGYTIHLAQWTRASVALDCGVAMEITADRNLPHLAVHRMTGYLCIEPVSHVAGAYVLPPAERATAGIKTLAPGETLAGGLRLRLAPTAGPAPASART
ncbi:MAG: aldose 1-epimerase [Allorhizobium sp.]